MITNSFEESPFTDPENVTTNEKTAPRQFLPLVEEIKSKSQARRQNSQSRTTNSQKLEFSLNYLQFLVEYLHTEELITPKTYERAFDAVDTVRKHV